MIPLSAVITTFNEEKNSERCLRSVQGVADGIVVLDSLSADRTKEIRQPLWYFIRQYFARIGFLDGYHGLVICSQSACANFIKYAKTRELLSAHSD
jgi:hypothetical protein